MHVLSHKIWFPPIEDALSDGLLAMGGDLFVDRLILAYQKVFSLGTRAKLPYGGALIQDLFYFQKN